MQLSECGIRTSPMLFYLEQHKREGTAGKMFSWYYATQHHSPHYFTITNCITVLFMKENWRNMGDECIFVDNIIKD